MPIARRSRSDIDEAKLLRDLAERERPAEAEIDVQASEDADAWTDAELAEAELVPPLLSPEQIRSLRERLGLTRAQFAHRFGLTVKAVQQYEEGRRHPSGPAATLLRVIAAEPDAVKRALGRYRTE